MERYGLADNGLSRDKEGWYRCLTSGRTLFCEGAFYKFQTNISYNDYTIHARFYDEHKHVIVFPLDYFDYGFDTYFEYIGSDRDLEMYKKSLYPLGWWLCTHSAGGGCFGQFVEGEVYKCSDDTTGSPRIYPYEGSTWAPYWTSRDKFCYERSEINFTYIGSDKALQGYRNLKKVIKEQNKIVFESLRGMEEIINIHETWLDGREDMQRSATP